MAVAKSIRAIADRSEGHLGSPAGFTFARTPSIPCTPSRGRTLDMTHARRWLGVTAIAAAAMAVATAPATAAEGRIVGANGPNAIKDSYIVVLKDNAASAATLASAHNA